MILYMKPQRAGGRRMLLAGVALAAVLAAWWLSDGRSPPERTSGEGPAASSTASAEPRWSPVPAAPRAVAPPAPTPAVAAAPLPVQYIGQWMEGKRQAVVLMHQGQRLVVRVPGRMDDRYEVVSADERVLVLRDRTSETTLRVPLGVGPSGGVSAGPGTAPATAAAAPGGWAADPTATQMRPAKLPPPSKRRSDEDEPEN
jgi:hypothetical protein